MNFEKPKEFAVRKVDAFLGHIATTLSTLEEGLSAHHVDTVNVDRVTTDGTPPLDGTILNQPNKTR